MCLLERFCKVKSEVMLLDIAFFVFIRENDFTFKKEKLLGFRLLFYWSFAAPLFSLSAKLINFIEIRVLR